MMDADSKVRVCIKAITLSHHISMPFAFRREQIVQTSYYLKRFHSIKASGFSF